jgi:hypothetical protein
MFVLRPMAFASPPDQSWLGGLFDDADYDDVILLITGACPATVSVATGPPTPTLIVVYVLAPSSARSASDAFLRSHDTRAPPLAI